MKKRGLLLLAAAWLALSLCAWLLPSQEISDSERRKLQQFPEVSVESILSGDFMKKFETYTLDQFPLRDTFRQMKALCHYYLLGQRDNNDIYIADGYAAVLEYPLNEASVENALVKFKAISEKYLAGSRVFATVVPDKGYFLAEQNGYPAMDYERLFEKVQSGMDWAEYVDITGCLSLESYYKTDSHWRQETLLGAAEKLCQALGTASFTEAELTREDVDRTFYGVYYGQAALPMAGETITMLKNEVLDGCTVYNHENGKTTSVYDMDKLTSRDLYDVFLSGATALLTIQNDSAATDRELIIFRDSFGSSMIPLLLKDYRTVTVIDIRYISTDLLDQFVEFHGQDVLFLYSTLLLNDSYSLK